MLYEVITGSESGKIPDWIKNNAGWWADGQIDDNSFVQGIQFLIKEGVITSYSIHYTKLYDSLFA